MTKLAIAMAAITIVNGDRRSLYTLHLMSGGDLVTIPPGGSHLVKLVPGDSISVSAALPKKAQVSARSFMDRAESALHAVVDDMEHEGAELSDAAALVYSDTLDLLGLHPADNGSTGGAPDPDAPAPNPEDRAP